MSTELVKFDLEKQLQIGKQMDTIVTGVMKSKESGFAMAFIKAHAVTELYSILTDDIIKPIKDILQGKPIGFKTDKDKEGGYKLDIVKDCVIEAVLDGLELTGNQFNIIAARKYTTKEGFTHLLKKENVAYDLTFKPIIYEAKFATVPVEIVYSKSGNKLTKQLSFPVKVNEGMGADAILGKAERKAKRWLYFEMTGIDINDGEAETINATYTEVKEDSSVQEQTNEAEETEIVSDEQNQLDVYFGRATSLEDLEKRKKQTDAQIVKMNLNLKVYNKLKTEFTNGNN